MTDTTSMIGNVHPPIRAGWITINGVIVDESLWYKTQDDDELWPDADSLLWLNIG